MKKVFVVILSFLLAFSFCANCFATEEKYAFTTWAMPVLPDDNALYDAFVMDFSIEQAAEGTRWGLLDTKIMSSDSTDAPRALVEYIDDGDDSSIAIAVGKIDGADDPAFKYPFDVSYSDYGNIVETKVAKQLKVQHRYSLLVYVWGNEEDEKTRMGVWLGDGNLAMTNWEMMAVAELDMVNAGMSQRLAQYIYNENSEFASLEREMSIHDLYAHKEGADEWIGLESVRGTLSNGGRASQGKHEYEVVDGDLLIRTGGIVEDQSKYDAENSSNGIYALKNDGVNLGLLLLMKQAEAQMTITSEDISRTNESIRNGMQNMDISMPSSQHIKSGEEMSGLEAVFTIIGGIASVMPTVVIFIIISAAIKKANQKTGNSQQIRARTTTTTSWSSSPTQMTSTNQQGYTASSATVNRPPQALGTAPKVELDKYGRPKPII